MSLTRNAADRWTAGTFDFPNVTKFKKTPPYQQLTRNWYVSRYHDIISKIIQPTSSMSVTRRQRHLYKLCVSDCVGSSISFGTWVYSK